MILALLRRCRCDVSSPYGVLCVQNCHLVYLTICELLAEIEVSEPVLPAVLIC